MRLKLGSSRNNEWTCFLCLHVRTATILLGIWHLMLHILALTVLALLMRNQHLYDHKFGVKFGKDEFQEGDFLPTPLSKIKDDDNPYYLPKTQDGRHIYASDMDMGALMTVCTLSITLLMVYGTIKGKATHLLPFFCLQLFDFAITMLTASGYICYLPSVRRLVEENWQHLPFRKELLQMSSHYLILVVLLAFCIAMLWKSYCITVVWRCYKYLTLRQHTTRNTIHYILPGAVGEDRINDSDYNSILRQQESMYGLGGLKQTPPPSYQDIMGEQPPPYPATVLQQQANQVTVLVNAEADAAGAVQLPENPNQVTVIVNAEADAAGATASYWVGDNAATEGAAETQETVPEPTTSSEPAPVYPNLNANETQAKEVESPKKVGKGEIQHM